jgi:hypothetical protein
MNRRGFLGTSGALVASWWLPRVALGTLPPAPLDLSPFCDDEYRRYKLDLPFEQNDWVYATDGRLAVRARPALCLPRTDEQGRLPPVDSLPWATDGAGWRPWSSLVRTHDPTLNCCPTCDGKGHVGRDVVLCNGECMSKYLTIMSKYLTMEEIERLEIEGEYFTGDCADPACPGYRGGFVCAECLGRGQVDYLYRFDDLALAPTFVARLGALPGPEVRRGQIRTTRDGFALEPVLQVRFDGGHGLLMPLNMD